MKDRMHVALKVLLLLALFLGLRSGASGDHALAQDDAGCVDIVLVMDASSSMRTNDEQDLRIKAAGLFVDLLVEGDRAAVVRFSGSKDRLVGLTEDKGQIRLALEQLSNRNIPPSGNPTDTSKGLADAYDILSERTQICSRSAVILMTDGRPCPSDGDSAGEYAKIETLKGQFAEQGWPIFTIGLCKQQDSEVTDDCLKCDEDLLADLALSTGGVFRPARGPAELPDIYVDVLARIYNLRTSPIDGPEPPFFGISPGTEILVAVAQQPGANLDAEGCPSILNLRPSADASLDPGTAEKSCVEDYQVVRVDAPTVGPWVAETAAGDVQIRGLLADVSYGVDLISPAEDDPPYYAGEQLPFEAQLVWIDAGTVVQDPAILEAVDLTVELFRDRDGEYMSEALLSPQAGSHLAGMLTLPAEPGIYVARPRLGGLVKVGEEVRIQVDPPPPTPTDTNTPVPPTPTDTPVPPTPTPIPTPGLQIREKELDFGWVQSFSEGPSVTFYVNSTSTEEETLVIKSIRLDSPSGQKVPGLETALDGHAIPPGAQQHPVTLVLTGEGDLKSGKYQGPVVLAAERAGVDVEPDTLVIRLEKPGFFAQYRWIFFGIGGMLLIGLVALIIWWRRKPWPGGELSAIREAQPLRGRVQRLQAIDRSTLRKLLRKNRVIVGSGKGADWQLGGSSVASEHVEFVTESERGGRITYITRLSKQPASVDGQEILQKIPRQLGRDNKQNLVAFGGYEFRFRGPHRRKRRRRGSGTTKRSDGGYNRTKGRRRRNND